MYLMFFAARPKLKLLSSPYVEKAIVSSGLCCSKNVPRYYSLIKLLNEEIKKYAILAC